MKIAEKLEAIKKLVFGEQAQATEYTLADGSVVLIDKLEVGGTVMSGDAPAPDGEHTLQDGQVIKVSGGLITEVVPKKEEPAPEEFKTPEQFRDALANLKFEGDNAKLVTVVKALFERQFGWELREAEERATRDAAIQAYKTGFANLQKANGELIEIVAEFAEQSKQEPLEKVKDWDQMTPLERYRALKK